MAALLAHAGSESEYRGGISSAASPECWRKGERTISHSSMLSEVNMTRFRAVVDAFADGLFRQAEVSDGNSWALPLR